MSGLAMAMKAGERCPICGKPDYCYWLPVPEATIPEQYIGDRRFIVCNRTDSSIGELVTGRDGVTYLCDKNYTESNGIGSRYYDVELRYARQDAARGNTGERSQRPVAPRPVVREEIREVKNPPREDSYLDKVYRAFLELLVLETKDREYLSREGIDEEDCRNWQIKSIPESDSFRFANPAYRTKNEKRYQIANMLAQRFDLSRVPGFRQTSKGYSYCGLGGILFPLKNAKGQIYALRLRVTHRYRDEKWNITDEDKATYKSGKYVNFSTSGEDGCKIGLRAGVFVPKLKGRKLDLATAYMTEGEKKCIVCSKKLGNIFIDITGVGCFKVLSEKDSDGKCLLDYLWAAGVQSICVAYDADKSHNGMVLRSEKGLAELLAQYGFQVKIAEWDERIGKGLDDLLNAGGSFQVSDWR